MATTTNYGWTTPDDTALVKDGAAAIRTLGSSVDTTVKALSPGTTAGDLDYYTSGTAKSRIGIGTSGQVLTVNGSNLPAWATPSSGGMTLLSTTTLSGTSTTISSISQSYNNLYVLIYGVTTDTGNSGLICAPNNDASAAYGLGQVKSSASAIDNAYLNAEKIRFNYGYPPYYLSDENSYILNVQNYTSSSTIPKNFNYISKYRAYSNTYEGASIGAGGFIGLGAITSLVFTNANSYNFTSGTVKIYGVK